LLHSILIGVFTFVAFTLLDQSIRRIYIARQLIPQAYQQAEHARIQFPIEPSLGEEGTKIYYKMSFQQQQPSNGTATSGGDNNNNNNNNNNGVFDFLDDVAQPPSQPEADTQQEYQPTQSETEQAAADVLGMDAVATGDDAGADALPVENDHGYLGGAFGEDGVQDDDLDDDDDEVFQPSSSLYEGASVDHPEQAYANNNGEQRGDRYYDEEGGEYGGREDENGDRYNVYDREQQQHIGDKEMVGVPAEEQEDGYLGGNYENPYDDGEDGDEYVEMPGVFRDGDEEEVEPLDGSNRNEDLKRQRGFRRTKRTTTRTSRRGADKKRRRRGGGAWVGWCLAICCCLCLLVLLLVFLLVAKFLFLDDDNGNDDGPEDVDDDDGFEPYNPYKGIVTTPFDEYERGDCYWGDNKYPHVASQCECKQSVLPEYFPNDTFALYKEIRKDLDATIYHGTYDEDPYSCTPRNQAMIWLASGDNRDGGDLYQRYILALFYLRLNGTKWDQGNLWLSPDSECMWFGVQCNGNFRLSSMSLDTNNVHGSLPTEIMHLENVKSLSVTRNHLTGTIPPEIFEMPSLTTLMLYSNTLRGSIPSEVMKAEKLQTLRLEGNLFFGRLVSEIGHLSNLEEFSVGFNEFWRHIPTEIGQLTNMRWLVMEDNRFSGTLHTEIGLLTNLEYISIQDNLMTGTLPTELASLKKLQEFRLAHTGIGGTFPPVLGAAWGKLHRLEMGYNNFEGTIPSQMGLLTSLSWLALNNNDFKKHIPSELGNLVNMTRMLLDDCLLTGPLPSEFGEMTQLQNLMIDKNQLSGTAPEEVCALRNRMMSVFVADCPVKKDGFVCPDECCSFCRPTDKEIRESDTGGKSAQVGQAVEKPLDGGN